jgi:hypothetical protein
VLITAFITNLDRHVAIPLEFPCSGEGMFGHPTVEFRCSFGSEGRNEAGLGLPGFGIAGEDDEAFTNPVSSGRAARAKYFEKIHDKDHGNRG